MGCSARSCAWAGNRLPSCGSGRSVLLPAPVADCHSKDWGGSAILLMPHCRRNSRPLYRSPILASTPFVTVANRLPPNSSANPCM